MPSKNFLPSVPVLLLCLRALTIAAPQETPPAPAKPPTDTPPLKIVAGPCLQNPTADSMTVVWMTDRAATGHVEFGEGEELTRKAFSSRDGLVAANSRLHRVTVRGLAAGGTYRYRVVSRAIAEFKPYKVTYGATATSETHEFRTLDPSKAAFSFVMLNDLHDKVDILARLIALADRQPYDFVFLNGDNINDPQSEAQVVNAFLRPCGELFAARVPVFYIRGNHETRGSYARELKPFLRDSDQDYYYAFSHGPARLVVLDSGEDKPDGHEVYAGLVDFDRYRDEQKTWLEAEVARDEFRQARFRIALSHIPLLDSSKGHAVNDCRTKWGKALNDGRLDLLLGAHLHRHQVLTPNPGVRDFPLVIGGAPTPGKATLTRIDVTATELTVTVTTDDDKVVHTLSIPVAKDRPAPPRLLRL